MQLKFLSTTSSPVALRTGFQGKPQIWGPGTSPVTPPAPSHSLDLMAVPATDKGTTKQERQGPCCAASTTGAAGDCPRAGGFQARIKTSSLTHAVNKRELAKPGELDHFVPPIRHRCGFSDHFARWPQHCPFLSNSGHKTPDRSQRQNLQRNAAVGTPVPVLGTPAGAHTHTASLARGLHAGDTNLQRHQQLLQRHQQLLQAPVSKRRERNQHHGVGALDGLNDSVTSSASREPRNVLRVQQAGGSVG